MLSLAGEVCYITDFCLFLAYGRKTDILHDAFDWFILLLMYFSF